MSNEQTEKENIIVDCDGVSFKVINAGSYEDSKTGEVIEYDSSIKISNGKVSLKMSAMGLAILKKAIEQPEVLKELKERLEVEKREKAKVGF